MEIKADAAGSELDITLNSDAISMQEAMDFKKQLSFIITKKHIHKIKIFVSAAYSLPSSIVGVLLKYKEIEHIQIEVLVKRVELADALEKLNLSELLNVKTY